MAALAAFSEIVEDQKYDFSGLSIELEGVSVSGPVQMERFAEWRNAQGAEALKNLTLERLCWMKNHKFIKVVSTEVPGNVLSTDLPVWLHDVKVSLFYTRKQSFALIAAPPGKSPSKKRTPY